MAKYKRNDSEEIFQLACSNFIDLGEPSSHMESCLNAQLFFPVSLSCL